MPTQYPSGRAPNRVFGVGGKTTENGTVGFRIGRATSPRGQSQGTGLFRSVKFRGFFTITGVTRNGSGTALAGVDVRLFDRVSNTLVARTTSDGSGNYSFFVPNNSNQYFLVTFLDDAPDLAGATYLDIRGTAV